MKTSLVILASVLLVLGMVSVAFADLAPTQAVTATVTVQGVVNIDIDSSSVVFGNVFPDDLNDKVPTDGNPITVTIDSNTAYVVKTFANQADFTPLGSGSLAASNLKWSTDDLTYSGYVVAPGVTIKSGTGSGNAQLYHKLTVPTGTIADTYSLPITLSITTP